MSGCSQCVQRPVYSFCQIYQFGKIPYSVYFFIFILYQSTCAIRVMKHPYIFVLECVWQPRRSSAGVIFVHSATSNSTSSQQMEEASHIRTYLRCKNYTMHIVIYHFHLKLARDNSERRQFRENPLTNVQYLLGV